jgi:hypothetical protein
MKDRESFETNHLIRSNLHYSCSGSGPVNTNWTVEGKRTSLAPLAVVSRSPRRVEMCGQQGDGVMRKDTKSKYFIQAGAQ